MDALRSLVQPLVGGGGGSSIVDGVKLVVLGTTVETARRVSSSAWYATFYFNLDSSQAKYDILYLGLIL
jgi:chaperone BCS1